MIPPVDSLQVLPHVGKLHPHVGEVTLSGAPGVLTGGQIALGFCQLIRQLL